MRFFVMVAIVLLCIAFSANVAASNAQTISIDATWGVLAALAVGLSSLLALVLKLTSLGDWIEKRRAARLSSWAAANCPVQHRPIMDKLDGIYREIGDLKTTIIDAIVKREA